MIPLGVLASRRPATGDGGVVLTESFNQPNSSTVGPDLAWTQVNGTWSTVSNRLSLGAAAGTLYRSMRAEHDLSSVDHYAQIDAIELMPSSDQMRIGVAVRFDAAATTYYAASYGRPVGGSPPTDLVIYKSIAGTITVLNTTSDVPATFPTTVRLDVVGGNLSVSLNGVPTLAASDSDITTGVRTGVVGNRRASASPWVADNFEAGDL